MIMVHCDYQEMIKCSNLEKKKEKTKWAQNKGILDRTIFILYSIHHRGCE
jgi:hypothetical protein